MGQRMKPIKFWVVPRSVVNHWTRVFPLPHEYLAKYLSVRPGILDEDKIDIFCKNCRSETQKWSRFELFERVDNWKDAQIIVPSIGLELFLAGGVPMNIETCLQEMLAEYPGKHYVFSWNHDVDAASMRQFQRMPECISMIQFNTSKPRVNDILVPFWTIATKTDHLLDTPKRWDAGFCGYVGSLQTRRQIAKAFRYREDHKFFFQQDRVPEDVWQRLTASFRFSLCPRGAGLSSYRFFESIHLGSIPVLFADDAALPYPDLDYSRFSVRIPELLAGDSHRVMEILNSIHYDTTREEMLLTRERFSLAGVQTEIYNRLQERL